MRNLMAFLVLLIGLAAQAGSYTLHVVNQSSHNVTGLLLSNWLGGQIDVVTGNQSSGNANSSWDDVFNVYVNGGPPGGELNAGIVYYAFAGCSAGWLDLDHYVIVPGESGGETITILGMRGEYNGTAYPQQCISFSNPSTQTKYYQFGIKSAHGGLSTNFSANNPSLTWTLNNGQGGLVTVSGGQLDGNAANNDYLQLLPGQSAQVCLPGFTSQYNDFQMCMVDASSSGLTPIISAPGSAVAQMTSDSGVVGAPEDNSDSASGGGVNCGAMSGSQSTNGVSSLPASGGGVNPGTNGIRWDSTNAENGQVALDSTLRTGFAQLNGDLAVLHSDMTSWNGQGGQVIAGLGAVVSAVKSNSTSGGGGASNGGGGSITNFPTNFPNADLASWMATNNVVANDAWARAQLAGTLASNMLGIATASNAGVAFGQSLSNGGGFIAGWTVPDLSGNPDGFDIALPASASGGSPRNLHIGLDSLSGAMASLLDAARAFALFVILFLVFVACMDSGYKLIGQCLAQRQLQGNKEQFAGTNTDYLSFVAYMGILIGLVGGVVGVVVAGWDTRAGGLTSAWVAGASGLTTLASNAAWVIVTRVLPVEETIKGLLYVVTFRYLICWPTGIAVRMLILGMGE